MTRRGFLPALFQIQSSFPFNTHDIRFLPPDLKVPPAVNASPKPGLRVRIGSPNLYHVLFLPEDWTPGAHFPLIVEYPGNGPGPLQPRVGLSVEGGRPDDTVLGFGLSAGRGFVWLSLPCVEAGGNAFATNWWGDPETTADYCRRAVRDTCDRFGGDARRILLCGFSRGSIACNFIGLRDDSIAKLWRAFFCHSHYDGVHRWPYPGSDRESALSRLRRLDGRPQFISHEVSGDNKGLIYPQHQRPRYVGSVAETRAYLESTGIHGDYTFGALPYPTHTDQWILRPLLLRDTVRQWLHRVLT